MKKRHGSLLLGAIFSLVIPTVPAMAVPINVANYSFETLPSGGLPDLCGGGCAHSIGPIPGWNVTDTTGQWITGGFAGNPNAIHGNVLAYSNYGRIWQDAGVAVAGLTYTLRVGRLHRTDAIMAGEVMLEFGGVPLATATGLDGGPGSWNDWTATYNATDADAGKTIAILLSNDSGHYQANFDNVRLRANAIPEPGTLVLLGTGLLGLLGFGGRRRRAA